MKKRLTTWFAAILIGCSLTLAMLAAAVYVVSGSEIGQWVIGLVMVYGGAMMGMALAYDVVPGVVLDVHRLDPPTDFSAGSLKFSYTDSEGREREEMRRVMLSTSKFGSLDVGDEIDVWVCRRDPSVVKLVGYGTHEPGTCGSSVAP